MSEIASTNGVVSYKGGIEAAKQVIKELEYYDQNIQGDTSSRSIIAGILAVSTVIGAITSIMGLRKRKKVEVPGDLEIEVINHSSFTLVPYTNTDSGVGFQQAIRPLVPGETGSTKWHRESEFKPGAVLTQKFLIGTSSTDGIEIELTLQLSEQSKWYIKEVKFDGQSVPDVPNPPEPYKRGYFGFDGNEGYPSFSLTEQGVDRDRDSNVTWYFADRVA
jgi:hypothetical protein